MCDACSQFDGSTDMVIDPVRLWELARRLDGQANSKPIPKRDWKIFQGNATGTLSAQSMLQMGHARLAAIEILSNAPPAPRFVCDVVSDR